MNVDDVDDDVIPEPLIIDRLDLIYMRQSELMKKYEKIEHDNFLLQTSKEPVDLHDKFGQARLKDFAWRIVEEITEATLAQPRDEAITTHVLEEIADAYHFLIELTILSGLTSDDLFERFFIVRKYHNVLPVPCRLEVMFEVMGSERDSQFSLVHQAYATTEQLGAAMNCLKNKPWKQTHILTDVDNYLYHIVSAHAEFIALCLDCNLTADRLYRMYYKKSEVNKFRQRSNY